MTTLVIHLPQRPRLSARHDAVAQGAAASREPTLYAYAVTPDGLGLQSSGVEPAAKLPRADAVVAVVADTDLSWHHITLPKASQAKMRAALVGVLEEQVLDDIAATHFAIEPGAVGGQAAWVAAINMSWLRNELGALERAQLFVDRVVPASWPDDPPSAHFSESVDEANGQPIIVLTWSHIDGVVTVRLQGALPRAIIPNPAPASMRFSATPGAAQTAEQWLGGPVNVLSAQQRLLQAARTLWNIRQFDLARRSAGTRALIKSLKRFTTTAWRPARYGLVALLLLHIVGLNAWAWHQRGEIAAKKKAMVATLQTKFPYVKAVMDAPAQMQKEVQLLRVRAGKASDTDLEPMLQAAAAAWPPGQAPATQLQYEFNKLTISAATWSDAMVDAFRSQLRPGGWRVDKSADGKITLSRATLGGIR